jgi:DNA-binding MarR family transcriptional regulator
MGVWVEAIERLTAIENCLKEHLAATDARNLDATELHVLVALYDNDGQKAGELAKRIGNLPTSFTPVLDRLERMKYIERKDSPLDRRVVRICLTDASLALKHDIREAWAKCEREFGE